MGSSALQFLIAYSARSRGSLEALWAIGASIDSNTHFKAGYLTNQNPYSCLTEQQWAYQLARSFKKRLDDWSKDVEL